jgi:hypothetical protein
VTGHRPDRLAPSDLERFAELVGALLDQIRGSAVRLASRKPSPRSSEPPRLRLISCLAEGSDQIAARAALLRGYTLVAPLPFARDVYADDFASEASRAGFRALLARAESVVELPGERRDAARAYEAAGHAVLRHCDLLIALWDGEPARGPGGTAEIVQAALRARVPVLCSAPGERRARVLGGADDARLDEDPLARWLDSLLSGV